jgi:hypothetical protein
VNEYTGVAEQFYVRHGRVSYDPYGGNTYVKPFTRELSELIDREVKKALAAAAESARQMGQGGYDG